MGSFFADEFHTLGHVLDVLRGPSNRDKLKESFAQTSQIGRCALFLAPAWDSGAAPCFLFEETAEKRVCVRQLASSMSRLIWVGAGQLRFARNPRPPLREEQPVLLLVREQHCFCPQLFAQSSK